MKTSDTVNRPPRTKVVIKRSQWSRGIKGNCLYLSREDAAEVKKWDENNGREIHAGGKCCLGFACLVLGAEPEQITSLGLPGETGLNLPGLTRESEIFGDMSDTEFSRYAANINDDQTITDEEREKNLTALAAKNGFDFEFID